MSTPPSPPSTLACVEVGGSSTQTVLFEGGRTRVLDGAHQPPGATLAVAVPGLVSPDGRTTASNLGWWNADPVHELCLAGPAALVVNDAAAAALGESGLRGGQDVVYVGLGTGIGGAVVRRGSVTDNLFGHRGGHGDRLCPCGQLGCLETVAAGWALPDALSTAHVDAVVGHLARALADEPLAHDAPIVVAGGLARRYPAVIAGLASVLVDRQVEASRAITGAKSAAAWGLRQLVDRGRAAR